jgi:hypothetical protein
MLQRIILSFSVAVLMVGCKKQVACSDANTQDLVNQTFVSQFNDTVTPLFESYTNLKVNSIQTTASDKDTGRQSCAADFNVTFKNLDSLKLSGNGTIIHNSITYDTQLTDDGDQQTIKIEGLNTIVQQTDAVFSIIQQTITNRLVTEKQGITPGITEKQVTITGFLHLNGNGHNEAAGSLFTPCEVIGAICKVTKDAPDYLVNEGTEDKDNKLNSCGDVCIIYGTVSDNSHGEFSGDYKFDTVTEVQNIPNVQVDSN